MPTYTNTVTSTHQDFTWTGTTGSFANISLIPGIEYNAQLEVERQFSLDRNGNPTIAAFLGSEFVSTQDKRQLFVIPNQYITYSNNKTITGFTLSNYNYTYYLTTDPTQQTPLTILVPNISTSVNTLFTVRRKSISNQALVTWADGGKLTSSQLNLQTQQLLFLAQETADRINTELSNATDIAYAIADGAITYTKILGDGVNAWNFASPIITISPTSNLHATTRLYTLNSIYNHGVITKDDTAPTSSAVDILETAGTAGNSGIWFDPKLGQLKVWAGNAWVALVGVPLSTNNIVDIGSTQTITGAKTFSSNIVGNLTGTATALATARTIEITGDVAYSQSFDGSANITGTGTLATVATAGTTGSASLIPVITINAKGLTTGITTAAVVADANTLSGTTLKSTVTASSLTTFGTMVLGTPASGTLTNCTSSSTPSGSTNLATKGYVDNPDYSPVTLFDVPVIGNTATSGTTTFRVYPSGQLITLTVVSSDIGFAGGNSYAQSVYVSSGKLYIYSQTETGPFYSYPTASSNTASKLYIGTNDGDNYIFGVGNSSNNLTYGNAARWGTGYLAPPRLNNYMMGYWTSV